jgi:hypothetical protein
MKEDKIPSIALKFIEGNQPSEKSDLFVIVMNIIQYKNIQHKETTEEYIIRSKKVISSVIESEE